jgi:outer membrane lipoprotein-sorting protein
MALSQPVWSSDEAMELAIKVYNRPAGIDARSEVTMILKGEKRKERVRKLITYRLDKGGGERWNIMRFTEPADVKNTALLTKDHPGDDSDQWIYLPALDRVRIISSKRKGGKFVGSDFTYEDLRDREPDMDRHSIEGKEKVGGLETIKLVSIPVDKSNSIYTKRISWIHEKSLTPLQVELFQKNKSKPVKRLKARKLKKIQGIWTVLQSTMYDLKKGNQTRLATSEVKYDIGISEELFSKRGLSDDSLLK